MDGMGLVHCELCGIDLTDQEQSVVVIIDNKAHVYCSPTHGAEALLEEARTASA